MIHLTLWIDHKTVAFWSFPEYTEDAEAIIERLRNIYWKVDVRREPSK